LFPWLALHVGKSPCAGFVTERKVEVAEERKVPDGPERGLPPAIKTRAFTLQLNELPDLSDEATPLDEYCHRDRGKLSEADLAEVIDSLRQEKQLDPVQVAKDERGGWVLLTGHRRVAALYFLAKKKVAGFGPSMAVAALEVTGTTPQDRLVRSVADNEVRERLDQKERLLVVQKFDRAGVAKKRAASALAISEKSYERDLRVARQPRMLDHVLKDHLAPGDASTLIQAAEKNHRAKELYDHIDHWVERTRQDIQKLDELQKAEIGKGLKPAELLVKNHLSAQVFEGWLESLERGTPFTDSAEFNFEATLDRKSGKLRVERLNIDTTEASVLDLAKLGAKLTQLGKRVLAEAQRKQQLEQLRQLPGPQAALENDPSPYDTSALLEFGLESAVGKLQNDAGPEVELAAEEVAPEAAADEATDGD
jgi:ParB-like chromosome segregation protein Spo0J